MDWSQPDTGNDLKILKVIFEGRPKILEGLSETDWEPLRISTAMTYLWGTSSALQWLPENYTWFDEKFLSEKFDEDTAVRMILFYARH